MSVSSMCALQSAAQENRTRGTVQESSSAVVGLAGSMSLTPSVEPPRGFAIRHVTSPAVCHMTAGDWGDTCSWLRRAPCYRGACTSSPLSAGPLCTAGVQG